MQPSLCRSCDPFMIDHMLCNSGFGDEAGATNFVKKFNAQVFYDESLILKDHAAVRQSNLLNPSKCPPHYKKKMINQVQESESFEDTGLSLEIMNKIEFWCGQVASDASKARDHFSRGAQNQAGRRREGGERNTVSRSCSL